MSSLPGTNPDPSAGDASAVWTPVLVRAIAALALGLAITFVSDHSAAVGLIGFGACAVVSGIVVLTSAVGSARPLLLAQGAVLLVGGVVALALSWAGPVALSVVVGLTALLAGALELIVGIRTRGASPLASDRVVTGALTVLLGAVVLAVPPGFAQRFEGSNGIPGMLTGSIVSVGAIGAWGVLVGVLLTIAAIGLRPTASRIAPPAESTGAARS